MAIVLYTGTPGSGKSMNLAKRILYNLVERKKTVIANMPVNMEYVTKKGKRKTGTFIYKPNNELTVKFLKDFAMENLKPGKESQATICIDEAAMMFNARNYNSFDRNAWIDFFMTHRHYGYDIILVAQNDRLIDRQIRAFIEDMVIHRKLNNYKLMGLIFTILRIPLFVAITKWYVTGEKNYANFFIYRRKYSKIYDTMMLFGGEDHGQTIGSKKQAEGEAQANTTITRDISKENEVYCHSAKYYSDAKTTLESFKFRGRKELAKIMAEDLAAKIKQSIPEQIDYVTWVPASEQSKKTRGFDQSELLAYWTAKDINKPAVELLINFRENQDEQKTLGKRGRMQNKAGAYKMTVDTLQGKTILIIDDIVTTGASLYEAAKTLSIGGAKKIICLTYAEANEKNRPKDQKERITENQVATIDAVIKRNTRKKEKEEINIWEQGSQQQEKQAQGKKKRTSTTAPPPAAAAAPGGGDAGAGGSPAPRLPAGACMPDEVIGLDAIDELFQKMKAV